MKTITEYKAFYFVGIGGIGMSALARYFKGIGKQVSGYDKTPSPITDALIQEGCGVDFIGSVSKLSKAYLNASETLVVYTAAVSDLDPQLEYFRENGFEVLKRSEALGLITRFKKALCVAGTHGKTTTSSIVAWILKSAKKCF
mgnify:CR=1 FL=1